MRPQNGVLKLLIVAASNRQPAWIEDGYADYAKRLRGRCTLDLKAVPLAARSASASAERAVAAESARLLAAIPAGAHVVALREQGSPWSTADLAAKLESWMRTGAPVCFLIGGPDGLGADCVARANEHWSLSRLTLPHGLVKVMAAEALYRAWSVLERHPYHRA
jgi:23S rRNA (pseudouridine1915-N3)-methyltransferase